MKIIADTNLLVRVLTLDDRRQARAAREVLDAAEVVALALPALCELVWILSRGYRIPRAEIAPAVAGLINSANAVTNRPAVEAGLATLRAGGDFADGVIAYEGRRLGGEVFHSFDTKAVRLLEAQGEPARLL